MKITATHQAKVEVDINPVDVLQKLKDRWRRSLDIFPLNKGDDVEPTGMYINKDGIWEYWTSYPHGSGTTTTYKQATEEEAKIEQAFRLIMDVTKVKLT